MKPHGVDVAVGEYPFLATLRDRGKTHGQPEAEGRFDVEPRELGRLQEGISLPSAEHAARMPFDGVERHAFIDRPALIVLPSLIDLSAFDAGKPLLVAVHGLASGPVVRFHSFYIVQLCHLPPSICAFNHTLYGTAEARVTRCG